MNYTKRTFEEVKESLRGKVILVVNRGIPARRICRSIGERFEAVSAMTVTDVDKTQPAAASAQELILLGSDPRAYLHHGAGQAAQCCGHASGLGLCQRRHAFPQTG